MERLLVGWCFKTQPKHAEARYASWKSGKIPMMISDYYFPELEPTSQVNPAAEICIPWVLWIEHDWILGMVILTWLVVFKYYVSFFQQNLGSFIEMTNIFGMGSVGLEPPTSNLPSMMTMVGA